MSAALQAIRRKPASASPSTPQIVATWYTGEISASVATFVLFTIQHEGQYRVSVDHICTTLATAGTFDSTVGFTDRLGAITITPAAQISVAAASVNRRQNGVQCFDAVAGSTVTLAFTFAGLVATPIVRSRATLERIA